MASKPNVLISYLHGAGVDSAFLDSLTMLLVRDRFRRVSDIASFESGPYITDGRNRQAEVFLNTSAEWLLMLDTDMTFPPDLIPRLLANATPSRIVGGLCFAYNGRIRDAQPTMWDEDGRRIESWTPGALVPVGFTGGACLMVNRRILEQMPRPWFRNADMPNGGHLDQDQVFCAQVRQAGHSIAVDTSLQIGHCKRIVVTGDADYVMPAQ